MKPHLPGRALLVVALALAGAIVGSVSASTGGTKYTVSASIGSTSLNGGMTLSGSVVWTARPSDPSSTAKVDFLIDGTVQWTEKLTPYYFNGDGSTLDTTTLANGSHILKIRAYRSDGKVASASATVSVSNAAKPPPPPPPPGFSTTSSIANGATLSGLVTWTASPTGATVSQVDFLIDGTVKWTEKLAPYYFNGDGSTLDTTTLANGRHTLSVNAYSSDGRKATASSTGTVSNATAPSPLTVTSNVASGATLTGPVTWTASTSGGTTSKVEFMVDGSVKSTDSTAPYQYNGDGGTLDTTTLANGGHTLAEKATATDGRTATASSSVTVSNTSWPPPPPPGKISASVLVAPGGSDTGANCKRFSVAQTFPTDRSTVCATFAKAYALAQPGDTILVGNGVYSNQRICRGGAYPQCDPSAGDRSAPTITFQAETAHGPVIHGELFLGGNDGVNPPPSYVTIDGVDVNGQIHVRATDSKPSARSVTFQNMHVWMISSQPELDFGLITWDEGNVTDLTFSHMDVGPACCRADAFYIGMSTPAVNVPVNLTIQDSHIHDLFDTCNAVPKSIISQYGPCGGKGFGDGIVGDHVDGLHLWGGVTNLHLLRNVWDGISLPGTASGQTIFLECGDAGGASRPITCTNIEIANNAAFSGTGNWSNVVSMGNRYPGTDGIAGDVRIVYNTFWNGYDGANSLAIDGFSPSATVKIVGNAMRKVANLCHVTRKTGSQMSPVYRNNEIQFLACDPSDHQGTPGFLSFDEFAPDEHLSPGQWAINHGETNYCPSTDVQGRARPSGGTCDVGAYEDG